MGSHGRLLKQVSEIIKESFRKVSLAVIGKEFARVVVEIKNSVRHLTADLWNDKGLT